MFLPYVKSIFAALVIATAILNIAAQDAKPKQGAKPVKNAAKPVATPDPKAPPKPVTAEQIVETSHLVYALGGGREKLAQIRKTVFEHGKMSVTNSEGKVDQVTFTKYTLRGETLNKERIRIDEEFSNARYSLIFADEKIFGVYNNTVFAPRDDASKSFEDTIFHGVEAYLRYKENESKIELAGKDKQMGVEFHLIDLTDKQGRVTRFYVSVRTFRVMLLSYEQGGVKYKRRFYNQNYAQGTLVPYRTVLTADDKIVEETDVLSISFGQKMDEDLFKVGS